MTTAEPLATPGDKPNNVVPFRAAKGGRPHPGVHEQSAQGRLIGTNSVAHEPDEQRLARRVKRVLGALLYHAALAPGDPRGSKSFSIEERVDRLVSHDRLAAIARAAIGLGMTADLTRLAAVAVAFELKDHSQWSNRMLRPFSTSRRRTNRDALAIARLLAMDLDALKIRPIDRFAKYL